MKSNIEIQFLMIEEDMSSIKEAKTKNDRPYLYLEVIIDRNVKFALPFTSNLTHPQGFRLLKMGKKSDNKLIYSGIDYSKSIMLNSNIRQIKYRKSDDIYVRPEEYVKVKANIEKIHRQFKAYVTRYIKLATNTQSSEYEKLFVSRSTLQNFHYELGLVLSRARDDEGR